MSVNDCMFGASIEGPVAAVEPFHDWLVDHQHDDVYFILGAQGSGTNLTARVLQSLFDFSAVLDGSLIFDAAVRVERRPSRDVVLREFRYVTRKLFPGALRRRFAIAHHHHRNSGFVGIERYFEPSTIKSGADFARFFYAYHAWKLGRTNMLIKSDDLWQNIDSLKVLFPRRRCVLLVRDPRDNALSISRKDFGPRDIYMAARLTDFQLKLYRCEADRSLQDSIIVQYETLLDDPMRFACAFAGQFGFTIPPDAADRIERLRIRSENSQKWKCLPSRELAACEWVLEQHLRDYGYPLSGFALKRPSLIERLTHRFVDEARRVPQKLGRHVRSLSGRS